MAVAYRLRFCIGLFGVVVAFGGCNSSPLPPPPTSPASAPAVPSVASGVGFRPPVLRPELPVPSANAKPGSLEVSAKPATASSLADSLPPVTSAPKVSAAIGKRVEGPAAAGNFIVALARDHDGNVWVGTEDKGVLRGTPNGEWTQFTTQDGLGDDNGYAICCDRLGRVWVGQLNHGVAVFNGETWKTYDVLDGPLGERVFDIACCPTDGDVWMATSLGLARYSESSTQEGQGQEELSASRPHKPWRYYTRAEGLPSDQMNSLAFGSDGTLFVGTQCDGLVIGKPDDDYVSWRTVHGELSDEEYRRPTGKGLPSNLINDVLVAKDGTVYVATNLGLAKSTTQGASWEFVRGRNYIDKVRRRSAPPPKSWQPAPKDVLDRLLPEDFVSCLAEDDTGHLYVGFRQQGLLIAAPKRDTTLHLPPTKDAFPHDWIRSLSTAADGSMWVGGYGHRLTRHDNQGKSVTPEKWVATPAASKIEAVSHPQPAVPPTLAELSAFQTRIASNMESQPELWGTVLNDDWATRGDWFGRLGRQYAVLCAAGSPLNHYVTVGDPETHYLVKGFVGPHGEKGEALRHWIHWMKTDQRRVLYNPTIGYRREAEWDDHGEAYPMTHEGPDVWINVTVPRGVHRLSLYFVNPNGHDGPNRFRDYHLELKPHAGGDIRLAERSKSLAQARVQDFWGGVYKQFVLKGPNKYWLKVGRNDSFNTIVSGVFLDQLEGPPWPYENMALPWMGNIKWEPPPLPVDWVEEDASDDVRKTVELKLATDAAWRSKRTASSQRTFHLLAYRAALADLTTPKVVIENWRWNLRLWTQDARLQFDDMMRTAWASMCNINPQLIGVKL